MPDRVRVKNSRTIAPDLKEGMDSADIYVMVLFRYTGAPYIPQLGVTKRAVVDSELRATYISIFNCVDRGDCN